MGLNIWDNTCRQLNKIYNKSLIDFRHFNMEMLYIQFCVSRLPFLWRSSLCLSDIKNSLNTSVFSLDFAPRKGNKNKHGYCHIPTTGRRFEFKYLCMQVKMSFCIKLVVFPFKRQIFSKWVKEFSV